METLSQVEHRVLLSPKEYNVLLAQLASRIANAYVQKDADRTAARDAVGLAVEIMERSGIQVAAQVPAPAPAAAAAPQPAAPKPAGT
jgi:hypothetical protein